MVESPRHPQSQHGGEPTARATKMDTETSQADQDRHQQAELERLLKEGEQAQQHQPCGPKRVEKIDARQSSPRTIRSPVAPQPHPDVNRRPTSSASPRMLTPTGNPLSLECW